MVAPRIYALLHRRGSRYKGVQSYLRKIGPVAIVYGVSVGALGLAELVYAHATSSDAFGQYAYYRQALPLVVALGLLGIEQSICREAAGGVVLWNWRREVPTVLFSSLFVAGMAATASVYFLGLSTPFAAALILSSGLVSVSEFSSAVFRADGRYSHGAIAQQGYRIGIALTLFGAIWLALDERALPWLLMLVPLPVALLSYKGIRSGSSADRLTRRHRRTLRFLGIGFAGVTLTGGAVDWLDQALLAWRYGSFSSSGEYAATKLVIVFPFISIASILAFSALPEVARRRAKFEEAHITRMIMVCTAAAAGLAFVVAAVIVLFPAILPTTPALTAVLLFLVTGVGRFLYIIPSAVLGALANQRLLYLFAGVGVLALVLEAAVILAIPTSVDPILAGAVAVFAAVYLRLAGGIALMRFHIRVKMRPSLTGAANRLSGPGISP